MRLLLLLMGSFMPTSVNLRGHSAQFTIECPPQTPTLPPPPNTDSVPGTSKVERHEQQQNKKKRNGNRARDTRTCFRFSRCLSIGISVCPPSLLLLLLLLFPLLSLLLLFYMHVLGPTLCFRHLPSLHVFPIFKCALGMFESQSACSRRT